MIDDGNFNLLLTQTDSLYRDDLLHVICELDIAKTISWLSIATAIEKSLIHMWQLLNERKLVVSQAEVDG